MKKVLSLLAVLTVIAAISVHAESSDYAARERHRTQIDTNATTTVTAYTPTAAGNILIGAVGGSNAVWIAVSTTTNDWVKIAQGE